MNTNLVKAIVAILNSDDSMSTKQSSLSSLMVRKRNESKKLILAIIQLLDQHIFPFKSSEKLRLYNVDEQSETMVSNLEYVVSHSTCNFFNAVCGEFLWWRRHKNRQSLQKMPWNWLRDSY